MSLGFIIFLLVPICIVALIIWDYEQKWEDMYDSTDWELEDGD